jgi:hypothetical protein
MLHLNPPDALALVAIPHVSPEPHTRTLIVYPLVAKQVERFK